MAAAQEQERESAVAAAVVEDVMRLHVGGCSGEGGGGETVGSWRKMDIAWRKAEEAGEFSLFPFSWNAVLINGKCSF
jgi:kinesin family protein C2/C3